ncbi:Synaptonemal complex central element protein 2, partial [Clarias magur]
RQRIQKNVDMNACMHKQCPEMLLSMCSVCQGFGISTPPTKIRQSRRVATLSADCKFLSERSTSTPGSVAGQCSLLLAPDPVTWQNRAVAILMKDK